MPPRMAMRSVPWTSRVDLILFYIELPKWRLFLSFFSSDGGSGATGHGHSRWLKQIGLVSDPNKPDSILGA